MQAVTFDKLGAEFAWSYADLIYPRTSDGVIIEPLTHLLKSDLQPYTFALASSVVPGNNTWTSVGAGFQLALPGTYLLWYSIQTQGAQSGTSSGIARLRLVNAAGAVLEGSSSAGYLMAPGRANTMDLFALCLYTITAPTTISLQALKGSVSLTLTGGSVGYLKVA